MVLKQRRAWCVCRSGSPVRVGPGEQGGKWEEARPKRQMGPRTYGGVLKAVVADSLDLILRNKRGALWSMQAADRRRFPLETGTGAAARRVGCGQCEWRQGGQVPSGRCPGCCRLGQAVVEEWVGQGACFARGAQQTCCRIKVE